jgi:hypothetical protein
MPRVQRKDVPRPLFAHLLQRIHTNPEVPKGDWFKRFKTMTVCGKGPLVKTSLTPSQVPFGEEL